jgi:hypothetical protein
LRCRARTRRAETTIVQVVVLVTAGPKKTQAGPVPKSCAHHLVFPDPVLDLATAGADPYVREYARENAATLPKPLRRATDLTVSPGPCASEDIVAEQVHVERSPPKRPLA